MQLTPYGPDAWLLHFAEHPGPEATHRRVQFWTAAQTHPPAGLAECVPGFTTLLFEFHPGQGTRADLRRWIKTIQEHPPREPPKHAKRTPVRIEVHYDGPDLERVATHCGHSVDEVVARHSATEYEVALLGFAPGFPYLDGLDPLLATPRLDRPRMHVQAGSVAIGGSHAGIYSLPGPGGWNILGWTDTVLFDANDARCLLAPGDRVRFRPC